MGRREGGREGGVGGQGGDRKGRGRDEGRQTILSLSPNQYFVTAAVKLNQMVSRCSLPREDISFVLGHATRILTEVLEEYSNTGRCGLMVVGGCGLLHVSTSSGAVCQYMNLQRQYTPVCTALVTVNP